MSILVTGATGRVGKTVMDVLLKKGIPFRVSSREPEKIFGSEKVPEGVTTVFADLDKPETLPKALEGIKRVFLYTKPEGVDGFVKEAEKAGVEYVVLLSSGGVVMETKTKFVNVLREMHIKEENAFRNSSLKWTFLRPVGFSGNSLRYWQKPIKFQRAIKTAYPNTYTSSIHERDIAEVAVVALTTDKLIGATPLLTGPEALTVSHQIKTISDAIKQPISIELQTHEQAQAYLSQFVPAPILPTLLNVMKEFDGVPTPLTDEVEKITGHKPRSFAQWVQENVHEFL